MSKDKKKKWEDFRGKHEDETMNAEAEVESGPEQALGVETPADLQDELTQAEQKAHENWEKAVRAMAELDNVRRRAERDVSNAHRYGAEKLINSLLPVVDSLDHALQISEQTENTAMHEGLMLTMKLFLDALAKMDVTQINPEGEVFNPQQHEAMTIVDAPDVPPNTVVTVFQKGYLLHDRVIRPARVIVSKNNG